MRLVMVSANVFVNPECISCVEQKNSEGPALTYVWVGDRSYVLTVPFDEFYRNLDDGERGQYFSG